MGSGPLEKRVCMFECGVDGVMRVGLVSVVGYRLTDGAACAGFMTRSARASRLSAVLEACGEEEACGVWLASFVVAVSVCVRAEALLETVWGALAIERVESLGSLVAEESSKGTAWLTDVCERRG